ncbi:hypothetical protein [Paenibacillus alvei]|uniref:Uncharacterized protein n=1 Tax=Paenibacillus alvei TaxID=44250 RepID=A0AAP7A2P3_PAEAL|nr:hypothetical protein [Paenibacillus alvei]NOJ71717.1 hypothetical protein [Paenibacillus alvei]
MIVKQQGIPSLIMASIRVKEVSNQPISHNDMGKDTSVLFVAPFFSMYIGMVNRSNVTFAIEALYCEQHNTPFIAQAAPFLSAF